MKRLASGQASQSWGVVTVPKTRKQNKTGSNNRKRKQTKQQTKPTQSKTGIVKSASSVEER